jgi:type II secretory ATPase GspE/PulE/Tfp pilus assembly ATPase PilB-like protein
MGRYNTPGAPLPVPDDTNNLTPPEHRRVGSPRLGGQVRGTTAANNYAAVRGKRIDQPPVIETADAVIMPKPPAPKEEPQQMRKADDDAEGAHHDAILFIRGVLNEAIVRGASDVHFEPKPDKYRIRFRVDGVLHDYVDRPPEEFALVVNSVKVLADLDIADRFLPQDGHIELVLQELDRQGLGAAQASIDAATTPQGSNAGVNASHYYDIRVSVFPSVNGEVVVMRILNRENALLSVEDLGMDSDTLARLQNILLTNYGMVLITGPTGSGKTTTLYSVLRELKSDEKNIMTLEDPIEFHLDWLRQSEISEARGFTYEEAMESVLRQDPDILMVGEIRDPKTAEYAVRSALVGRIVGSTIHANTTIGTIARLLELGIPRSLLAHTINGVITQRLVRKVCIQCAEAYEPHRLHLAHFGLEGSTGPFYRGAGCDACGGSGYKGRVGLFSLLTFDDTLRTMIFDQRPLADIQEYAIKAGMKTLKMDAAEKVLAGATTVEEAVRVV